MLLGRFLEIDCDQEKSLKKNLRGLLIGPSPLRNRRADKWFNRCPLALLVRVFRALLSSRCVRRDSNPLPSVSGLMLYLMSYFNRCRFGTRVWNTMPQLFFAGTPRLRNAIDQTLASKQERSDSNTVHRLWRPSPLPGEHS